MKTAQIPVGRQHDILSRVSRGAAVYLPTKTVRNRSNAPLVSFTFDDIPDSALINGARVLEGHGVRGTFYVSGGLCGSRFQDWTFIGTDAVRTLLDLGHEVGCHTFSHPDVQTLTPKQAQREIEQNGEFLGRIDPRVRLTNFAYPYGSVGLAQKGSVQSRFRSCRGVRHGINAGRIDLGHLRAVQLYNATLTESGIDAILDLAARQNGWVIFYTHDVAERPSEHGCSPRLLDVAVTKAKAAGYACLTVDAALDRIGAP
jgi:peptidoglycan/xylan/chitin deacetylase (PgdA/CDA1 family)